MKTELTELQWNKLGYVLNKDAKEEYQPVNGWHQNYCTRYKESEVHKDEMKAKEIISKKQKEYYLNRKKKEKAWREFEKYRNNMKTYYQWLEAGRIPNEDAKWDNGEHLNYLNKHICEFSFGSGYWYCYISDTHEPKDNEELEKERVNQIYQQKQGE